MKRLQEALTSAPVLVYPDFHRPFELHVDACNVGGGAVLCQRDEQDRVRVVAYWSMVFNSAEQRYATVEQECLALVRAVTHFRPYIYGRRLTVYTDHAPLKWLMSIRDPAGRLTRWSLLLADYDLEIIHRSGAANTDADGLSRSPVDVNSRHTSTPGAASDSVLWAPTLSELPPFYLRPEVTVAPGAEGVYGSAVATGSYNSSVFTAATTRGARGNGTRGGTRRRATEHNAGVDSSPRGDTAAAVAGARGDGNISEGSTGAEIADDDGLAASGGAGAEPVAQEACAAEPLEGAAALALLDLFEGPWAEHTSDEVREAVIQAQDEEPRLAAMRAFLQRAGQPDVARLPEDAALRAWVQHHHESRWCVVPYIMYGPRLAGQLAPLIIHAVS